MLEVDRRWMRHALDLARLGEGNTSPNPCVGAILVRGKRKIGQGWHQKAGAPHAEMMAIGDAKRSGRKVAGSALYVTLEPCSTYGRTPPCTESIIENRITRVVVGCRDPNPKHRGRGIQSLLEAGVMVEEGVCERECATSIRTFAKWISKGRPWVLAKAAITLNGKMSTPIGHERWITGQAARRDVHLLRSQCDAILIGAETARRDNPRLTVRGLHVTRQPWRALVTRKGLLPGNLHLLTDRYRERTLIYQGKTWNAILADLAKRDVLQLMVEGGAKIFKSLIQRNLIDEVCLYYAPKYFHDPKLPSAEPLLGLALEEVTVADIGPDRRVRGIVKGHLP